MITCGSHGEVMGYIVCNHILAGAKCVHFLEADPHEMDSDALGEALCATCHEGPELNVDDLKLVCGPCLEKVLGPNRPH